MVILNIFIAIAIIWSFNQSILKIVIIITIALNLFYKEYTFHSQMDPYRARSKTLCLNDIINIDKINTSATSK